MLSPASCRPPQYATGKCPYTVLTVTQGQLPGRVIGMDAERIQLLVVQDAVTHTGSQQLWLQYTLGHGAEKTNPSTHLLTMLDSAIVMVSKLVRPTGRLKIGIVFSPLPV
jgi:hypothetical protein